MRDRGRQRRLQRPGGEGRFLPPVQIGRDHRERNLQRGEILRHSFGQKLRAEFLGVELRRLAEGAGEQVGQRAGARGDQPARDLGAVMRQRDDVAADVLAAHAGGISGADQRADRGAGDGGGLYAQFVERLDHRDMREPARAAAAERERKRLHAPAPARTPRPWRRAGRTNRLWRRQRRWSRCRRARGRRCPAGSRRGGRNCRRNRPADAAADRARCARHRRRHKRRATECRARRGRGRRASRCRHPTAACATASDDR